MMNAAIVFDADNTLWDTNAVFTEAQLELLRVFEKEGLLESSEEELSNLRQIDHHLIGRSGNFEYDFVTLAHALAHYYGEEHVTTEQAVNRASRKGQEIPTGTQDLIVRSMEAFDKALKLTPHLDEHAVEVLNALRHSTSPDLQIVLCMFSDGKPDRLKRILKAHHLDANIFDEIVIDRKSAASFAALKHSVQRRFSRVAEQLPMLFLMVGDSLQRDIAFANQAGFTTVYKPADFLGTETPANHNEEPDFRIDSLAELIPLLEGMGISLERTRKTASKRRAAMIAVR
jgi:putative hydrolase of the HAD superfamily